MKAFFPLLDSEMFSHLRKYLLNELLNLLNHLVKEESFLVQLWYEITYWNTENLFSKCLEEPDAEFLMSMYFLKEEYWDQVRGVVKSHHSEAWRLLPLYREKCTHPHLHTSFHIPEKCTGIIENLLLKFEKHWFCKQRAQIKMLTTPNLCDLTLPWIPLKQLLHLQRREVN